MGGTMAVSIIDGRVDVAEIKRKTKQVHQYRTLRFALDDGGERTLANAVVGNELAAKLQPGAAGRFYLFKNLDLRGVYAYRDPSGAAVKAHPNNLRIMVFLVPLALVGLVLFEVFGEGTPLLYLIGLVLMIVATAYGLYTQRQADRVFAEDRGAPFSPSRRD